MPTIIRTQEHVLYNKSMPSGCLIKNIFILSRCILATPANSEDLHSNNNFFILY